MSYDYDLLDECPNCLCCGTTHIMEDGEAGTIKLCAQCGHQWREEPI